MSRSVQDRARPRRHFSDGGGCSNRRGHLSPHLDLSSIVDADDRVRQTIGVASEAAGEAIGAKACIATGVGVLISGVCAHVGGTIGQDLGFDVYDGSMAWQEKMEDRDVSEQLEASAAAVAVVGAVTVTDGCGGIGGVFGLIVSSDARRCAAKIVDLVVPG